VILDHVDHSTVLNPILLEKGIRALMGVPLIAGGKAALRSASDSRTVPILTSCQHLHGREGRSMRAAPFHGFNAG
jgi:hypothetical protein